VPNVLQTTITHYAPWDEEGGERARCGARVVTDRAHSTAPTCPACAASVALLEDPPPPADPDGFVELPEGPDWRHLVALIDRLAAVYTVDTDQAAVIRLVDDARAVRAGGRR
jgi:hypothetical protein